MHDEKSNCTPQAEPRLKEALSSYHAGLEIPAEGDAWARMQERLSDLRPARKRRSRLKPWAAAAALILFVPVLFWAVAPVKAITGYFFKSHQGVSVNSVEFGNYDMDAPVGMLTSPPPEEERYGAIGSGEIRILDSLEVPSIPEEDPAGSSLRLSLEEAASRTVFAIRVPASVPDGFVFKDVKLYMQRDKEMSHDISITYVNPEEQREFVINQYPVSGRTGSVTSVTGSNTAVKEVKIRGSGGYLIASDRFIKLQWLTDSLNISISGHLSEKEALEIAESIP